MATKAQTKSEDITFNNRVLIFLTDEQKMKIRTKALNVKADDLAPGAVGANPHINQGTIIRDLIERHL